MVKGMGKYQLDKAEKSQELILHVLIDGKPHRHKEIKQTTGLNDPTLKKYFDKFLKMKLIEKKVDFQSGKYPYPAYYSIRQSILPLLEVISTLHLESEEIERIVQDPKKTPLDILDQINVRNNTLILQALKDLKENRGLSMNFLNFLLEVYVWSPYKFLTSSLLQSTEKVIDKIDFEKLIEQSRTALCIDKTMLEDAGLTKAKIKAIYERMGRGDLLGE